MSNLKKDSRVQFYAKDSTGRRRIFSFKVNTKEDAINALTRMNVEKGFFVPNAGMKYSEPISNKYYSKSTNKSFIDRLEDFMKLK